MACDRECDVLYGLHITTYDGCTLKILMPGRMSIIHLLIISDNGRLNPQFSHVKNPSDDGDCKGDGTAMFLSQRVTDLMDVFDRQWPWAIHGLDRKNARIQWYGSRE